MKKFIAWLVAVSFAAQLGAAEGLPEQLQRGLFEEEANRNLDAAIKAYQSVINQSDEERKVVATAVFRLAECYRKLGKTNEANAQYQRIVRDFSDQEALVALSQSLLPRDVANAFVTTTISDPAALKLLRDEIALAEKQVLVEEKKAAAGKTVLSFVLEAKRNVLRLKRLLPENATPEKQREVLREQIALVKKTVDQWKRRVEVGTLAPGDEIPAQRELLGLERELAMISDSPNSSTSPLTTETMTQAEADELARVKALAKNSPDLLNAAYRDGLTPLQYAAQGDFVSIVEHLLAQGVDVNGSKRGAPPLVIAAGLGHLRIVEILLDHGADVNGAGPDGKTALLSACEKGFNSVAELLLKRGADVNRSNRTGETALHFAVKSGQSNIVALLLAQKAAVDVLTKGNSGNRNYADIRSSTFDQWHGITPLHIAARSGFAVVAKLLLDAGASVDSTNDVGTTPLHIAAAEDHTNVVAVLLAHKANPHLEDDWGTTPFAWAISYSRPQSVALFLRGGADVNRRVQRRRDGSSSLTPLHYALGNSPDSLQVLDLLLAAKPNLEATNSEGRTPLQQAVIWGSGVETVKRLLNAGANANVIDVSRRGETPLFWTMNERLSADVAKALLDARANPNVINATGDTPLSLALAKLNPTGGAPSPPDDAARILREIVDLLHQHGADELMHRRGMIYAASGNAAPTVIFSKGTNQLNRFTIFELLATIYENGGPAFPFPDFARTTVRRLEGNLEKTIPMPLRDPLESGSCSEDQLLEWGDVVEIPVGDHALNVNWPGLFGMPRSTLTNCLKRTVAVSVAGVRTNITLLPPIPAPSPVVRPPGAVRSSPFFRLAHVVLRSPAVSQLLRASTDLSHVVVTRVDPQSKETRRLIFDVNAVALPDMSYSKLPPVPWTHDLWLRDGDVIEIPEKQSAQVVPTGRPSPASQPTSPAGKSSSRILPANR